MTFSLRSRMFKLQGMFPASFLIMVIPEEELFFLFGSSFALAFSSRITCLIILLVWMCAIRSEEYHVHLAEADVTFLTKHQIKKGVQFGMLFENVSEKVKVNLSFGLNWSSQFLCQPVGLSFCKQDSQSTTFPQHERSECVGLSACVKHCHVVPATNCCWLEFGCVHP